MYVVFEYDSIGKTAIIRGLHSSRRIAVSQAENLDREFKQAGNRTDSGKFSSYTVFNRKFIQNGRATA